MYKPKLMKILAKVIINTVQMMICEICVALSIAFGLIMISLSVTDTVNYCAQMHNN